MSRFTKSIPNLLNGVSQQAPQIRRSSQAEIQENAVSSIVNGLSKRPPTEHIGKISSTKAENSYVHFIERDSQEQYALIFGDESISAVDLEGNSVHVEASSANLSYLSCSDPASELRAVSIRDFTYLVNKTIKPKMSVPYPAPNNPTAVVNVISARFDSRYEIKIDYFGDEYVVRLLNGDGSQAGHSRTVSIANTLFAGKNQLGGGSFTTKTFKNGNLVEDGGGLNDSGFLPTAAFNLTLNGSTIVIECSTPNQDFTISTTDDFDNQAIKSFKDVVQTFSSLPSSAVDEQLFKVNGMPEQSDQAYYVKYVVLGSKDADQNGYWKESVKGNIPIDFDASTMPHVLINKVDNAAGNITGTPYKPYFELAQEDWADRTVGDDNSNPEPSFINQAVEDIFEFRGRLGIITKFNVILSESNEPSNFWRTTVTTLVDSDPIDVEVSDARVVNLQWAQPWSGRLILFSDLTPYLLDAGEILTSQTVNFTPLGSAEVSDIARPALLDDRLYFASPLAGFTQIEEMYIPDDVIGVRTENVTQHVQKYIDGKARNIIASNQQEILIVIPESGNSIYLYQFAFNRNERVQSAWHKWTFNNGSKIINGMFFDNDLYLIIDRIDGAHLEKIVIDPRMQDGDDPKTLLDSRVDGSGVTLTYDSGTDQTSATFNDYELDLGITSDSGAVPSTQDEWNNLPDKLFLKASGTILEQDDSGSPDREAGLPWSIEAVLIKNGSVSLYDQDSGTSFVAERVYETDTSDPRSVFTVDGDTIYDGFLLTNCFLALEYGEKWILRLPNTIESSSYDNEAVSAERPEGSTPVGDYTPWGWTRVSFSGFNILIPLIQEVESATVAAIDSTHEVTFPDNKYPVVITNTGEIKSAINILDGEAIFSGDLTESSISILYAGIPYKFRYRFSRPYPKLQASTGEGPLVTGDRLQIAEWTIVYDRTSYFEVRVYYEGYTEPYTYTFDISTDPVATANGITQDSDNFIVPVRGENHRTFVDVVSADPSPLYIVAASYSADFFPRTRRNT